jgi:alcohol dehydrogenase
MYYENFGGRPTIATVPDPTPTRGGVVVQVEASGICRSDWHGWLGHDPDIALPHVPGHELAGTVIEVGAEVRRWRVGDRVTVPFVGGCGSCDTCASGGPHVCPDQFQPGFTHWGAFAEYVAIDYADKNVVSLPSDLESTVAATLGCRVATAFRAVVHRADVRPGSWLAVHGCGGVGLSAVMIAHALGIAVVGVDVDLAALSLATEFGAAATIDARSLDPDAVAEAVIDATAGGSHASIDAIGSASSAMASIMSLRRRGRHVQVGLMTGTAARSPIAFDRIIAWELDVLGSHGMPAADYPALLDLIVAGRLPLARLIHRTVSLDGGIDALMAFGAPESMPGITVISQF